MKIDSGSSLIFLHIPKTAGSTFHMILNSRFSESETQNLFGSRYSEPEIAQFINAPAEAKKHIRLLKGHMPFGLHQYLPGHSQYISVLRDPVERVISQYYYIKKNVHNPLHEQVEKGGMSIAEFVSSGIAVGMNNGQCRFLNGDLDEFNFDTCDVSLFENVKKHIDEQFIWLGITERFDESILLLSILMGWEKQPHYIRENISKTRKSRAEISAGDIEVIKRYNEFDMQLYQYANELLDENIASLKGFQQDVDAFKLKNVQIQRRWSWLPDQLKKLVV
jgi:hypothetical protein